MMGSTTTSEGNAMGSTVRVSTLIFDTTKPNRTHDVVPNLYDTFVLEPGQFVACSRIGVYSICELTGRTRKFFGLDCPTVHRFEVDTVVMAGAIVGVPGRLQAGTFATRPENVVVT
jgi:hypothetical protein